MPVPRPYEVIKKVSRATPKYRIIPNEIETDRLFSENVNQVPYEVKVPVDKPYPVYVPKPYNVEVEKRYPGEL